MGIFSWIILSIFLVSGLTIIIRMLPVSWGGILCFIFPLLLTPYWLNQSHITPFMYAKVYSLCVAVVYIQTLRFLKSPAGSKIYLVFYYLVALNILEAIITDIIRGSTINAIAGIILILTLKSYKNIYVDKDSKYNDFHYNIGLLWIIGYTVWNFTFVYSISKGTLMPSTIVHLSIPLLLSIKKESLYLQYRAISLLIIAAVYMTFYYEPYIMRSPNIYNIYIFHGLSSFSLLFMLYVGVKYRNQNCILRWIADKVTAH